MVKLNTLKIDDYDNIAKPGTDINIIIDIDRAASRFETLNRIEATKRQFRVPVIRRIQIWLFQ